MISFKSQSKGALIHRTLIRMAVIEGVQRHIGQQKIWDDITLLVLKQV